MKPIARKAATAEMSDAAEAAERGGTAGLAICTEVAHRMPPGGRAAGFARRLGSIAGAMAAEADPSISGRVGAGRSILRDDPSVPAFDTIGLHAAAALDFALED